MGGGSAGGGAIPRASAGHITLGLPGSGGGYSEKFILAGDLADSETVTVGAGGVGAAGTTGGSGGTSSFGSHLQATGATGGNASTSAANTTHRTVLNTGVPGVGSGGDLNLRGGPGDDAHVTGGGSLASVGKGGASFFGPGPSQNLESAGTAAVNPGAGGGGMRNNDSASQRTGGNGADGIVIVELYY